MKNKTKKLSFNALALGNLKHRKKQYILLIIGIILSMVFSSGATFFAASAVSSAEATKNFTYGKADTIVPFIDSYNGIDKLLEENYSQLGFAQQFGVLTYKDCELSRGAAIASYDDTAKDLFVDIIEGEYPKNKNEIAIEKEALMRLKVDESVGVGDTIEFNLYPQNNKELLEKPIKTKFKISGIIANKRVNIEDWAFNDYEGLVPAVVVSDDYLIAPGGKAFKTAFAYDNMIMTRNGFGNIDDTGGYYDAMMAQKVSNIELTMYIHWEVWSDALSIDSPLMLSVILAVVMMIVSNIGIINSFSANLKERKKQIGLLRSVGATKKQIIKLYMREAIVLSLICAPISVPISMGITYLTVPLFGENYVFTPEIWVIPVCVVISIIFIWLSALVPLISASRISPMQAIRSVEMQRKLKRKKIKTQKHFDVPTLLAKRNTVLYKSRGALTSLIIAVSIFISTFAFSLMEKQFSWRSEMKSDYYMTAYTGDGASGALANFGVLEHQISENDVNDVMMNGFVESVALRKTSKGYIEIDEMNDYIHAVNYMIYDYGLDIEGKHLTLEDYAKETRKFSADYIYTKKTAGIEKDVVRTTVCGYDDETLKFLGSLLAKGDFNLNKIKSGEEVLIYCPETISLWIENQTYNMSEVSPYSASINSEVNDTSDIYLTETEYDSFIKIGDFENCFKIGQEINLGWLYADEGVNVADNEKYIVSAPDKFEKKVNKTKIGGFIYDTKGNDWNCVTDLLRGYEGIFVITSNDVMNRFCKEDEYDAMEVRLNTECTEEINNNVMKTLEQIGAGAKGRIESVYQTNKDIEESNTSTLVMFIAVIAMLFTFAGSLVNNSITARIRESKKAIGTLRAVGASTKELTLSYIKQFTSVLIKGVIGGFGSFFAFIGIWELALRVYEDSIFDDLTITLWQTLIAILLLFISCVINMYSKVKKEMKNSIVENIREL